MTFKEFIETLKMDSPEKGSPAEGSNENGSLEEISLRERSLEKRPLPAAFSDTLTALWWDKNGDWNKAHLIAQKIPTVQGSAVHAYLHREEGVLWNADYWYSRAGRKRPGISLGAEWRALVEEMLSTQS